MSAVSAVSPAELIQTMGARARAAGYRMARLSTAVKVGALHAMADAIEGAADYLQTENAKDLAGASALTKAAQDRLRLTPKVIAGVVKAVREIAALPDPIGALEDVRVRPNGLRIGHMRSPLGVIGIIYESRPNVTADAGALCLMSGNAVILRGGSEAFHSNTALAKLMNEAGAKAGLPPDAIQLVPTTDREAVGAMLKARQFIDVIIPRGGKSLVERVSRESEIPVIKHLDGNCTVYVDEGADLAAAVPIVVNSKVSRPSACNSAETLLVHRSEAGAFLPNVAQALLAKGVELRGCEASRAIVPAMLPATEEDWYAEYLELILAVKIVDSFEDAVTFINKYGSHHTESILTRDHARAMEFLGAVDSACVHINTSTRFSDGGEYGLGAEIGISTDKLHARGPMGLRELTNAKWVVFGNGQIRE